MKKVLVVATLAGVLYAGSAPKDTSPTTPTIVTEDNFPQAYTNLRLSAVLKKSGGVNKFFTMPVPSSIPEEQFVVRMNRDTPYSISVFDMTGDVYVTVP